MLSRHSVGTHQGNELRRNSSENDRPKSPRLAEPLWTSIRPKEWKSCSRADLHFKNKRRRKKARLIRPTFPPNSHWRGNSHQHTTNRSKCKIYSYWVFVGWLNLVVAGVDCRCFDWYYPGDNIKYYSRVGVKMHYLSLQSICIWTIRYQYRHCIKRSNTT